MTVALPDIPAAEAVIIEMTNGYRSRQRLAPVAQSPALRAAAKAYADLLARTGTLSHTAGGTTLTDRVANAGYNYCEVSENLSASHDTRGFETRQFARTTVEGWINSPGHRRNIEAADVTETGVAVARVADQHPKYVVVQLFARPQALSFEIQISNSTRTPVSYAFGSQHQQLAPGMANQHATCTPTTIAFDLGRSAAQGQPLKYEVKAEAVYVITDDPVGNKEIRVEPLRRIP